MCDVGIDANEVYRLAALGARIGDIAGKLGVSKKALNDALKDDAEVGTLYRRGRADFKLGVLQRLHTLSRSPEPKESVPATMQLAKIADLERRDDDAANENDGPVMVVTIENEP